MNIQFDHIPQLLIKAAFGPKTQEISSVVYDSSEVVPGSAFFCIIGENTNGHLYIDEALANGAVAIIGSDSTLIKNHSDAHKESSFIVVDDAREALAYTSIYFFGNAQDRLIKVGVTGTNGKTTTATYVYELFNLLGIKCGFLGTTGTWSSAGKFPFKKSTPTTPISSDIHNVFSKLVAEDHQAAAMEVSSIALDQKRVEGMVFDVAIHTNISEEHLEYHKVFNHYLQSKLQLFNQCKSAVVNLDDSGMAKEILEVVKYPCLTYSQHADTGANLVWSDYQTLANGMSFTLSYSGESHLVTVPLYGIYNAANLTAAIGAALLSGISIERILEQLPKIPQVEGRFQLVMGPENRRIILDYAHTPVALAAVMEEAKKLPHNRLIALVAGIGIRDFAKMPKMAKAAEGKADVLIVSVDHPGDHDPALVVNEVLKGFTKPYRQKVVTALGRKQAVIAALEESGPNDIVLLSSGNINGCQIVKGEYIPHSDEEVIEEFFMNQN